MLFSFLTRALVMGCFLFLLFSTARAAGTPKNFIYRIKVTNVTDKTSFEGINRSLETIFDSQVRFNDVTDEIVIHSDMNISKEKLTAQLTQSGHVLKSYRQVFIRTGQ